MGSHRSPSDPLDAREGTLPTSVPTIITPDVRNRAKPIHTSEIRTTLLSYPSACQLDFGVELKKHLIHMPSVLQALLRRIVCAPHLQSDKPCSAVLCQHTKHDRPLEDMSPLIATAG